MSQFAKVCFLVVCIFKVFVIVSVSGDTLEDQLTLTYEQKNLLDKFRENIQGELVQEYMNQDIYLVKWLREAKFNLQEAERKLLDNLAWRKANNIDEIKKLDWSEFESNYPYTTDVYDRQGRPSFVFSFGEWDIRKAAVRGQSQKFVLYWAKALEELVSKIRNLQAQGQNVTQGNIVVDIKDYNVAQHSCPQCIGVYTGFIQLFRNRYPGDIHRATLVNAPRIFEVLLQVLGPVMGENYGNSFKIFGTNKRMWQSALYKDFAPEQLPVEFGGTKVLNDIYA